jgi:hypothetical protein
MKAMMPSPPPAGVMLERLVMLLAVVLIALASSRRFTDARDSNRALASALNPAFEGSSRCSLSNVSVAGFELPPRPLQSDLEWR